MMRFLCYVLYFLVPPPLPSLVFPLALPCKLAAVADALLGMVHSDLLLLLLPWLHIVHCLLVSPTCGAPTCFPIVF
jgi:hypothetical protein